MSGAVPLTTERTDRSEIVKPDVTPPTHPNLLRRDADRRGRVQEGVAIVLALLVLAATFVVAAASVAEGTVPSASRTEAVDPVTTPDGSERCERTITVTIVTEGATAIDRICSFGPSRPAVTS